MNVYFRLYASDGTTLVYTFPVIFSANYPHTEKNIVEHINPRGKGSLLMDTGDAPWTLDLKGVLFADDYEALTTLVDAMETAVALNTKFVLKINKTVSTFYSYNCKRVTPIIFQEDNLRTNYIEYQVTFRINCW